MMQRTAVLAPGRMVEGEQSETAVYRIMVKFFVTTHEPGRRRLWLRLFETAVLPVISASPETRRFSGGGTDDVYVLDASRLLPIQRYRLAGHVARKCRDINYPEALHLVNEGWPITAEGCELVVSDTTSFFVDRRVLCPKLPSIHASSQVALA